MDVTKTHQGTGKPNVKWENMDLKVQYEGTRVTLPNDPTKMPLKEGIKFLKRLDEQENTEVSIADVVNCHFYDGIVAFARALNHRYGMALSVPTPGFFGDSPPHIIPVRIGTNSTDVVQVPFGNFRLPNVDGVITTRYTIIRSVPCLQITATVKQRDKDVVVDLVALTKKFSQENSIYRGKSIILDRNESGNLDFNSQLKFFDPNKGVEIPIFDEDTSLMIERAIFTPIRNIEKCRKNNIPFKRGVLLEGPYGTGKSLVAKEVAKVCNENDVLFISCTEASALQYALHFAKMYQPCVVFAEDMDRIAENRNDAANSLINDIDGVVSKNDEVMVVFTTNHAKNIEKAFLRPGRLDAVISLRAPEKDAVTRLVRFYAGDMLDEKTSIDGVVEHLAGQIPATIGEVVKRAKLDSIMLGRDKIDEQTLIISAKTMENQLKLLDDAKENQRPIDPFAELFRKVVKEVIRHEINGDILVDHE